MLLRSLALALKVIAASASSAHAGAMCLWRAMTG
jgi:hypothetical protein